MIVLHRLILCWLLLLSNTGQSETLKEIYQLAKDNDHQLQAERAAYLANQESAAINRAALLPQIGGTVSVTDNTVDNANAPREEFDETSYEIALTQSIINASDWHRYKQGKIESKLAATQYAAAKQSLIFRTTEAYVNVLRAIDQLRTSRAEEKAFAHQLEQTKQRHKVGLISINDVLEAQAAHDSAVANTFEAQGELGIQFDALGVLTGHTHDSIAPLKRNFPVTPPMPAGRKEWVALALAGNYDLMAGKLATEAAAYNTKSAISGHYPTLYGDIRYATRDRSSSLLTTGDTDVQRIGLVLNIPIYTGGNTSARRRQAHQSESQSREEYLLLKRNTIQTSRALHLLVLTDVRQVAARRQAIISNQSALEAVRAGYDTGTRNIVDVVNAQNNLFQAQRDYSNTLYDYILNSLQLEEVAGRLAPAALEHLEAWLNIEQQISRQTLIEY